MKIIYNIYNYEIYDYRETFTETKSKLPSGCIEIEESEIKDKLLLLKLCYYKRTRAYPPITDLADALVKKENGDNKPLAEYVKQCLDVKAKYPKP